MNNGAIVNYVYCGGTDKIIFNVVRYTEVDDGYGFKISLINLYNTTVTIANNWYIYAYLFNIY